MQETTKGSRTLVDASRLIIESLARAGADSFIGYPITPANLLYAYSSQRMPLMLPAPDEITTVQWMTGLAATGKIPVTATSFPGFALMVESINMAYMMELPMIFVLVQRLGPATGTATCGAQGDLLLLKGMISGGHPIPVLCTSNFEDSWQLSEQAVKMAVENRTPVVLLTTKEEVMTHKSFCLDKLNDIKPVEKKYFSCEPGCDCTYKSYDAKGFVPDFLPVTQNKHQVRINASTHDKMGILQHSNDESMANTRRLEDKNLHCLDNYTFYEYDEQKGAENLVVAYGITSAAAQNAVIKLRHDGIKTSLLVPKTLLPVPKQYLEIIEKYSKVVIAEENINNQFGDILFGANKPEKLKFVGSLGKMITPQQIIKEVL
jgi:2-oxoglutarate/2-oxoacid ferredoxin oxidoreductase subunit alpha